MRNSHLFLGNVLYRRLLLAFACSTTARPHKLINEGFYISSWQMSFEAW